jgi:transcriptional regulator with XRE-family HTH domain
MSQVLAPNRLLRVNAERGKEIKRRRVALGMNVKALAERAGIDRGRLSKLEAGDPSVRETTIGAVEAALTRLEVEMGYDTPAAVSVTDDLIEFRVSGNFGVDVVVKGPVRDMDALERSVERLIRRMEQKGD